jgi:Tat protein translocase TatB subunit
MNFFGMGYQEILVILVIALVVFGPGKLPEVMGQVGKAVRDFRRMTADLTGEFEKTIGDPNEIRRALTGELEDVKSQVTSVTNSVKKDMAQASSTISSAASTAKSAASAGSKSTTAAKTTAAKATPAKTTTSTAAKSNASTASKPATGKTASTAGVAKAPAATKADPLADVSFFEDDDVAVTGNGHAAKPQSGTSATAPSTAAVNPTLAPSGPANGADVEPATDAVGMAASGGMSDDALARARQRRQSAGYRRRQP